MYIVYELDQFLLLTGSQSRDLADVKQISLVFIVFPQWHVFSMASYIKVISDIVWPYLWELRAQSLWSECSYPMVSDGVHNL